MGLPGGEVGGEVGVINEKSGRGGTYDHSEGRRLLDGYKNLNCLYQTIY